MVYWIKHYGLNYLDQPDDDSQAMKYSFSQAPPPSCN